MAAAAVGAHADDHAVAAQDFEHHVSETCTSIVRQLYERSADVVTAAATVLIISAKPKGGDPEVEATRAPETSSTTSTDRRSSRRGSPLLEGDYLDRHAAVDHTAAALRRAGIEVKVTTLVHGAVSVSAAATAQALLPPPPRPEPQGSRRLTAGRRGA